LGTVRDEIPGKNGIQFQIRVSPINSLGSIGSGEYMHAGRFGGRGTSGAGPERDLEGNNVVVTASGSLSVSGTEELGTGTPNRDVCAM
jgi:hypothetical protein